MQALSELFLKPLRALTGGDIHPGNSDAVQHAFVHNFTENYCNDEEESDRPPFSLQNWNEVLTTSKKDGKFVVIYLHSEMHDDTQTFCEEALRDQGVIDFMNNGQTLVWGADVVSLNLFFLLEICKHKTCHLKHVLTFFLLFLLLLSFFTISPSPETSRRYRSGGLLKSLCLSIHGSVHEASKRCVARLGSSRRYYKFRYR